MRARATGLTVLLLAVPAPSALAAWAPGPEVVSVDNARLEQGDGPTLNVDLAAGGRYVVFDTQATNFFADDDPDPAGLSRRGGIFRYDRQTGGLELVADGDEYDAGGNLQLRGAANPSVSADGRYVVFSTAQPLVPQDNNGNTDVYVRDMTVPLSADRSSTGAYRLVSALDGTDVPPNYDSSRGTAQNGRLPGTNVYPGAAISDDGRFVAFRTQELASDLAGTGPLNTPPGTVFVRDLQEGRTTLVSRGLSDGGPVGNAEAPVVLSADGTTVSWVGFTAQQQTHFISGEASDQSVRYYLWRRWADVGATTRRLTGFGDPDDPACPANGTAPSDPTSQGPCAGPLTSYEASGASINATPPSLSADGYTAAFLTGAGARPTTTNNPGLDAFVTDMHPGVSRKAGTTPITADTALNNARANGDVTSVALSEDGRHLAFTTSRTQFLLASPQLMGPVRTAPGPVDIYVADLGAGTMERAIFGPGGADANGPTLAGVSLAPDAASVAYVSSATDLFVGDANEQPDAFVSHLAAPGATVVLPLRPRPLAAVPAAPKPAVRAAMLKLRAVSRSNGSVRLTVTAPAAGRVVVLVAAKGHAKASLAQASRTLRKAGTSALTLKLHGAVAKRARHRPQTARATVRFTPRAGGAALRRVITVHFVVKHRKK